MAVRSKEPPNDAHEYSTRSVYQTLIHRVGTISDFNPRSDRVRAAESMLATVSHPRSLWCGAKSWLPNHGLPVRRSSLHRAAQAKLPDTREDISLRQRLCLRHLRRY